MSSFLVERVFATTTFSFKSTFFSYNQYLREKSRSFFAQDDIL